MKEEIYNTSPILLHAQTSSSASCRNYWSDEETAALIEAYRDKWYYLKLGKLSATHWQQVADEVMARCNTHKTSLQCSRKMQYLRKRYHDEIKRARNPKPPQRNPYAWVVRWVHFHRMDSLENGYGLLDLHADPIKKEEDDYEQEEKGGGDGENQGFYNDGIRAESQVRVMDQVLDPGQGFGLGGGYVEGGFGKSEDGDHGSIDDWVEEMVAPIETSGDEFVEISKMKMAEAGEVETSRMELEMKMILE